MPREYNQKKTWGGVEEGCDKTIHTRLSKEDAWGEKDQLVRVSTASPDRQNEGQQKSPVRDTIGWRGSGEIARGGVRAERKARVGVVGKRAWSRYSRSQDRGSQRNPVKGDRGGKYVAVSHDSMTSIRYQKAGLVCPNPTR